MTQISSSSAAASKHSLMVSSVRTVTINCSDLGSQTGTPIPVQHTHIQGLPLVTLRLALISSLTFAPRTNRCWWDTTSSRDFTASSLSTMLPMAHPKQVIISATTFSVYGRIIYNSFLPQLDTQPTCQIRRTPPRTSQAILYAISASRTVAS